MRTIGGSIILLTALLLCTCEGDSGITATDPPGVDLSMVENPFQEDSIIHAAPGKTFSVHARLTDEVGLKEFRFFYPDWYLDNTVDLTWYYPDETLYEYDMAFQFRVPADASYEEEFVLQYTATNLGGLSSEKQFLVRMDGDYEAPRIFDVAPANNEILPSDGFRIGFKVSENEELKYVVFRFPAASAYDSVTSFRGGKAFSYDEPFEGLAEGNYDFTIRAVDMFENAREKNVNFLIRD